MFDWLKRNKKEKKEDKIDSSLLETKKTPQKPKKTKPKLEPISDSSEDSTELFQPGKLLLKQQVTTESGTERTYVQPVKLEVPNMVTVGGKLDTILDELDKKPNKEWFQNDYIETLKNVLTLTNGANIPDPIPSEPQTKHMAETIETIQKEVSSALIFETLKIKGPLSISELSNESGVSRVTVWRDLKKMAKEGKIKLKRQGKFKVASIK